jgi:hypothetical protein
MSSEIKPGRQLILLHHRASPFAMRPARRSSGASPDDRKGDSIGLGPEI